MGRFRDAVRSMFGRSPVPAGASTRIRQPGFGNRVQYTDAVLPGLTPDRIRRVLRQADKGDIRPFLTAAAELEERDAQYGPQLAVRKMAISALELAVHRPAGANARAAKATQKLLDSKVLSDVIPWLLDGLGKGFAISEIVWELEGQDLIPRFVWHDPRNFQWDSRFGFRLRDDFDLDGIELAPLKWVVHVPKIRTGIPTRNGLARPAMFLHMAKSMSLHGWIQLMALYGLPIAVATIHKDASANDRATIAAALEGLGEGVNAMIPDGAKVEIIKAADAGASPDKMFSSLLEYVDKQISKLVLGQTMTADDGSSQSQATVHDKVRQDIREADAEQLARTINEYIVKPYVDLNIGPQKVYPEVFFVIEEERDLAAYAKVLFGLMDRGLPIRADDAYNLIGLSKPSDGDVTIGGKPPAKAGAAPAKSSDA